MNRIPPQNVHETLNRHMLADGMDLVFDLDRSQGNRVYDSRHDRWFIDFFSFFASAPVGHNHPDLTTDDFVRRLGQVAVNNVTNSDLYTVEMAQFVQTFSDYGIPDYLPNLFLVAGGGLAVENALKTAFDWKIRKNIAAGKGEKGSKVIHFRHAFHGRTGYTLSLTNTSDPRKTAYFPKFDWPRVDNPSVKYPLNDENLADVKAREDAAVRQIEAAIAANPDDIAALIIEPVQGEGGDNHFRDEFMVRLRQICDDQEIFFIFDEVQTGVGLTGKFWAHEHFSIKPDAICFGKKTQVCGILVSDRVKEVEKNVFAESSRLNSTWGGNLVDMVRFTRYLEIIKREELVQHAASEGEYLLQRLQKLEKASHGEISNVRGKGLMCAFDMTSGQARDAFLDRCYQNGIIILGSGDQSVRFRPSLNIDRDLLDEGLDVIQKSLKG